jgi:hypothetical protein
VDYSNEEGPASVPLGNAWIVKNRLKKRGARFRQLGVVMEARTDRSA